MYYIKQLKGTQPFSRQASISAEIIEPLCGTPAQIRTGICGFGNRCSIH